MTSQGNDTKSPASSDSIVLFDGVCNLCNRSVNFIIDHDARGRFRFASLQSPIGRALLASHGIKEESAMNSIVLIQGERSYRRSAAILRIARRLSGLWPILYLSVVVPAPIRDFLYNWIARNRYRWFGRHDACRLPTPEASRRFLE